MQGALSIDIKSTHKRCVVKPAEQGLLGSSGINLDGSNSLYFYRACPFGATFAQHWWGRLGSGILHILLILIWVTHTGHLFVDDYLFFSGGLCPASHQCYALHVYAGHRAPPFVA